MEDILYKMDNFFLNFKNKTILITGASAGIGYATASLLDSFGAKLILHASNVESIKN